MRVVIADDEALLREGLARLLAEAGFVITGLCADAESLLRTVDAQPPDVAIVDIRMPPGHGSDGLIAAQDIRRRHPAVGVLVLSRYTTSTRATQPACWKTLQSARATCSRNGIPTSPSWPTASDASTRANA